MHHNQIKKDNQMLNFNMHRDDTDTDQGETLPASE